jgi:uncharacterized protein with GYD domain
MDEGCAFQSAAVIPGKGFQMSKYLVSVNYTTDGLKGILKEGGTGRVEAINKLFKSVGCKVESLYFAFGETDLFVILDAPDQVTAAGLSLIVSAAGAAKTKVTVLLSPEEIDAAVKINPAYRLPGQ